MYVMSTVYFHFLFIFQSAAVFSSFFGRRSWTKINYDFFFFFYSGELLSPATQSIFRRDPMKSTFRYQYSFQKNNYFEQQSAVCYYLSTDGPTICRFPGLPQIRLPTADCRLPILKNLSLKKSVGSRPILFPPSQDLQV